MLASYSQQIPPPPENNEATCISIGGDWIEGHWTLQFIGFYLVPIWVPAKCVINNK